jgi:hypothetical protein
MVWDRYEKGPAASKDSRLQAYPKTRRTITRPAGLEIHPILGKSRRGVQKHLNAQKLRRSGRQLASVDDSPKGWNMTPIEFRDKKTHEIQEILGKLSSLDSTSFSPENKDRLFCTYQRQLERLTAIVSSPSLERLCSG